MSFHTTSMSNGMLVHRDKNIMNREKGPSHEGYLTNPKKNPKKP